MVMPPSIISRIFRRGVGTGAEGVANVAKIAERGPRLKPLQLPEGQALDVFFPEIKYTSNPFPLIASAEAGNPDAMLALSDRFTSRAKTLESGAITGQLDNKSIGSELQELWTRGQKLREMAMTLLVESAQRGNQKAQTRLMELVSQKGHK